MLTPHKYLRDRAYGVTYFTEVCMALKELCWEHCPWDPRPSPISPALGGCVCVFVGRGY
jgi:hypothetical protein